MDKESVNYFMTEMTQEEFNEICKFRLPNHDFETGMSKEDRFRFNMIRYEIRVKDE